MSLRFLGNQRRCYEFCDGGGVGGDSCSINEHCQSNECIDRICTEESGLGLGTIFIVIAVVLCICCCLFSAICCKCRLRNEDQQIRTDVTEVVAVVNGAVAVNGATNPQQMQVQNPTSQAIPEY